MKKLALCILVTITAICAYAQITPTATYEYVKRDSSLYFDLYKAPNSADSYTVIFVFGGGFIGGSRNEPFYFPYYSKLLENNINVVAIVYSLGLKGVKGLGVFNYKPLENAIAMAAEDLLTATKYIMEHEKELQIDSKKLIIAGSSAGAITVLQADYELGNRTKLGQILPDGFRYAGVISHAGAIFSTKGKVKYRHQEPAPTMLLHGTADRLVNYKQIKMFNIGLFGSSKLVKRFDKYGYPYYMVRYNNIGHEVAAMMFEDLDKSMWFIENYIVKGAKIHRDDFIDDPTVKRYEFGNAKPSDLY
ncbi:MAG: alpha/beta hydrolase fold domain-containing protein [Bacteroidales bacterium]|nr:alpha/beta hydrolase fold domain-containing protein [Bacteroidales bacterium]